MARLWRRSDTRDLKEAKALLEKLASRGPRVRPVADVQDNSRPRRVGLRHGRSVIRGPIPGEAAPRRPLHRA